LTGLETAALLCGRPAWQYPLLWEQGDGLGEGQAAR
jgi:hypothetical protein